MTLEKRLRDLRENAKHAFGRLVGQRNKLNVAQFASVSAWLPKLRNLVECQAYPKEQETIRTYLRLYLGSDR